MVRIALKYRGYGFKLSELVGEGNLGLLQAVRRFEPARGLRFMTYASYWVRANILAYVLKSWSVVSVGTGPLQSKLFFRLHREKSKLVATLGEGPEVTARLATMFNCTEDRIRSMQQRIDGRDLSLDGKAYRDSNTTVLDTLSDGAVDQGTVYETTQMVGIVRARVGEAMNRFDERERLIVQEQLGRDQGPTTSAASLVSPASACASSCSVCSNSSVGASPISQTTSTRLCTPERERARRSSPGSWPAATLKVRPGETLGGCPWQTLRPGPTRQGKSKARVSASRRSRRTASSTTGSKESPTTSSTRLIAGGVL